MNTYVWSDAWLLLSLIYGGEPLDRQRIRDIGDHINHAVFTDDELRGGLRRLRLGGQVERVGRKYAPSTEVLKWYETATRGKSRTYVLKDLQRVEEYLGLG